jgi:hypothetical protein
MKLLDKTLNRIKAIKVMASRLPRTFEEE